MPRLLLVLLLLQTVPLLARFAPPPSPDIDWPDRGVLVFTLQLERDLFAAAAPGNDGRPHEERILATPLFDLELGNGPDRAFARLRLREPDGLPPNAPRLDLPFLDSGRPYRVTIGWNLPRQHVEIFLNGVHQGDLFHGRAATWTAPETRRGPLTLVAAPWLGARVTDLAFSPEAIDETSPPQEIVGPPLAGEGRQPAAARPLDLGGLSLREVWAADFSRPLLVVREDELFEGGRRVREPAPDAWVLEGEGEAFVENGELVLRARDRDSAASHLVLWAPRADLPADLLVGYDYTPTDAHRGLHILFLNATARDGGSIFAPGLPRRAGVFAAYTQGALDSYHISSHSTDAWGKLRRTSNLRKNHGFFLLASGDDLIGGAPGTHHLRVLKLGGRLALEVDGRVSLDHIDTGARYGPVIERGGRLGLRIMAHTGEARFANLRVWSIAR